MTGERKNKDKEKLAIDPDVVRELARLLDETGLSEIEFERDGQRVRVARQAHGLKGSCRNMGALPMSEICQQIEQRGKAGTLEGVLPLIARAEADLRRAAH